MKNLLLLLFLTLNPLIYFSQCCPYIDSVEIIPEYPNSSEDTKVILTVTTPNQGHFISAMTEIETNNIMVEACYYSGFLTALQTYVDTVNLGLLPEGEYNLEFTATQSGNPDFCDFNDSQTTVDTFTVGGVNDIVELENVSLKLYPNPNSTGKVEFETEQGITEVKIYDAQGKMVEKICSDKNEHIQELNVAHLRKEIYFLHIILSDSQRIIHELILQ